MGSKRWRQAAAAVVALLAVGGVLSPVVDTLGAGSAPVLLDDPCVGGPLDVSYDVAYVDRLDGYGVTGVRVDGLDPRCGDRALSVALTGPDGAALADVPVHPVEGGAARHTGPLTEPVAVADVARISAVLHTSRELDGTG